MPAVKKADLRDRVAAKRKVWDAEVKARETAVTKAVCWFSYFINPANDPLLGDGGCNQILPRTTKRDGLLRSS